MSREWTERHIRELIEDELRNVKPSELEFVRCNYKFQVPHYQNNNMLEYMMINHLTMINYEGQIVGKALFSAPDSTDYSTYAFYSKNGYKIFGLTAGNIGSDQFYHDNPYHVLPEFVFKEPDAEPGHYKILTPYVYDGPQKPTRSMFAYPDAYALMKTETGDKKFDLDIQWTSGELKNPDGSGTGWFTELNYLVPFTSTITPGFSNWNEYDWNYRDSDAGDWTNGGMIGVTGQLSTHTIHFVYHYVDIISTLYDNQIWR